MSNKNKENQKEKKEKYYCKSELLSRGWTKKLIDDFLPSPQYKRNPHYRSAPDMQVWLESVVLETENSENFKEALSKITARRANKKAKEENRKKEMKEKVENLIPENPINEYPLARSIKRKFILHIGPTNSGKTYNSLERLKGAKKGAYLAPLRLLALEIYDKFNADGIPCSMLTGEEFIDNPSGRIIASTIEMMDTSSRYDVVVIDEVQMISDQRRGHSWTKAILGMYADEIHLCMAPEAEKIAIGLINECGDTFEVMRHERATALTFEHLKFDITKAKPGDALIVFSRRSVLTLAADLETIGIKASVIYGNLPPSSRREQVRRFLEGETQVVVSTDAIGMGINLPIRRVVFMETWKYDGERQRRLLPQEIKQIAGRAGRFGMYDEGYVLSVGDRKYIENALHQDVEPIDRAYLGLSEEIATLPYPLPEIAEAWESLESPELYRKMDMTEILELHSMLVTRTKGTSLCSRDEIYKMVTCSVDQRNTTVLSLWLEYCITFKTFPNLRFPSWSSSQLGDLEDAYKCMDLYFQFSRRLNKTIDYDRLMKEKIAVAKKINDILRQQKSKFQKRCSCCSKPLPYNSRFGLCEECYAERAFDSRW